MFFLVIKNSVTPLDFEGDRYLEAKMQTNLSTNTTSAKKSFPTSKVALAGLALLGVVLLVWLAPAISSLFEGFNGESSGYSTLSLVPGASQTYRLGSDSYSFSYKLSPSDSSGLFYASQNAAQTRSYPAVAGAVYRDLGLEMKVSSVTPDLMVLKVKPLAD